MITETKEELMRQLTEAWYKLGEIDSVLEKAAADTAEAHKSLRAMIRKHRNDQTTVRGSHGLAAADSVDAGSDIEANAVHRVSDARTQYPLRPR